MAPVNVDHLPGCCRAFRISEEHVAKPIGIWQGGTQLSFSQRRTSSHLEHELGMLRLAHQAGLRVPRPEKMYQVTLPYKGQDITTPALVMEYIAGTRLIEMERMGHPKYPIVLDAFTTEKQKAINLGFKPDDCVFWNTIWNEERGLYLIDLEYWRKR